MITLLSWHSAFRYVSFSALALYLFPADRFQCSHLFMYSSQQIDSFPKLKMTDFICVHSQKKCWNDVDFPHILRFWHFPPWLDGGLFLSYLMWLLSWSIVCGFFSSNNRHLTDKVDFSPQPKCHQNLNNEVIYKVEISHWNKTIATKWNIQRMPFKVAGPHYYNDIFGRV